MAGRPITRARRAEQNPLLYFSNQSSQTAAQVRRSDRPVLSKGYRLLLQNTYEKVPLDVVVLVYSYPVAAASGEPAQEELRRMAARGGLTVLVVHPRPESEDELHPRQGTRTGIPRDMLGRGRKNRRTSMTPFTLLHRLGDYVQDEPRVMNTVVQEAEKGMFMAAWNARRDIGEIYEERDDQMLNGKLEFDDMTTAAVYCAGVDTAAGRLGLLTDMGNVTADLFAKYLITGRVAYNPEASEINGVYWKTSKDAQAIKMARRWYAEQLPSHLKRMAEACRGKVWYF